MSGKALDCPKVGCGRIPNLLHTVLDTADRERNVRSRALSVNAVSSLVSANSVGLSSTEGLER